jgi:hypothetical protein
MLEWHVEDWLQAQQQQQQLLFCCCSAAAVTVMLDAVVERLQDIQDSEWVLL